MKSTAEPVKELILYSDSCVGQNKNRNVANCPPVLIISIGIIGSASYDSYMREKSR